MKVLIACEESQTVCKAFRELGHEAYSCDIIDPSGGHPEWHIKCDALKLINGRCEFKTMDGKPHNIRGKWDLLIAHPPCTYLTVAANKYYSVEKYGEAAKKRQNDRYKAIVFFMNFILADCDHIAVENPVGIMSSAYRKADQIIQPWEFGHPERKATCLWLKNLPKLAPTDIVKFTPIVFESGKTDSPLHFSTFSLPAEERSRARSKTFSGIAKAMAEQWGGLVKEEI